MRLPVVPYRVHLLPLEHLLSTMGLRENEYTTDPRMHKLTLAQLPRVMPLPVAENRIVGRLNLVRQQKEVAGGPGHEAELKL